MTLAEMPLPGDEVRLNGDNRKLRVLRMADGLVWLYESRRREKPVGIIALRDLEYDDAYAVYRGKAIAMRSAIR